MPESPTPAGAVFLSYAREDSEAARRMADAMRAFGLEVWFDQSELRGGDTWDAKIKTQIRTCALFVPIISAHTQRRAEGYFRREWKFGVERTHDMASGTAFVVPVVIDDTLESDALVPEEFMRFQWTRLQHGFPTPEFIAQVKQLLANPRVQASRAPAAPKPAASQPPAPPVAPAAEPRKLNWAAMALAAVIVLAASAFLFLRKPQPPPTPPPAASVESKAADASASTSKSIAVLPFANFSQDKDNEFFADGLQDEVITALAKIHDLKVISRTSVLAYRNPEGRNLKKIGTELGVSTVLEGSVQRVGSKVHLNVQLIDARTDDHLWADSYTEDLTDIFTIESSLAQQIATSLKASLTTDEQALINRRPTQNQEAYDLYLRGRVLMEDIDTKSTLQDSLDVIAIFDKAAAKDPLFSLPHVQASIMHEGLYWYSAFDSSEDRRLKALSELQTAERLAPSAPETSLAQAEYDYVCLNDWAKALAEYRQAAVGLPNDAQVRYGIGRSLRRLGRYDEAFEEFQKAAALNPNDDTSAFTVVEMCFGLHRFDKVVEFGRYYGERFPKDDFIASLRSEAQFQIDGDRTAHLARLAVLNPIASDPHTIAYFRALASGDLATAEREISNPDIKTLTSATGSITYPADLDRAYMAYLLGKKETAKTFADQAISACRTATWTRRQLPWSHMCIAEGEAYEGDTEVAVRDGKAAMDEMNAFDAFDGVAIRFNYATILVIAGRNDEALAVLREAYAHPLEIAPRSLLYDPIWGRLKGDPRLAEILDNVKSL
jgi:TolB-like protein